jgi:hypothetical protein
LSSDVAQTRCAKVRIFCRGGDQRIGKRNQRQAKGPLHNWSDLGGNEVIEANDWRRALYRIFGFL